MWLYEGFYVLICLARRPSLILLKLLHIRISANFYAAMSAYRFWGVKLDMQTCLLCLQRELHKVRSMALSDVRRVSSETRGCGVKQK